jgi:DNA-binding NarL/FixJ family response regulator
MNTLTVLLVGDARLLRGLRIRLSLEPDIAVAGEAESLDRCFEAIARLRPDVLLVDLEGCRAGCEVVEAIRALNGKPPVLALGFADDADLVRRLSELPGAVWLAKERSPDLVAETVRGLAGRTRR